MDIAKLIAELREDKLRLDEAIAVLERLATRNGRGGGTSRVVNQATRRRMAIAQRKRWSRYRKQKAK